MVNINLLDWRGNKVAVLNHRFYVILGVAVAITVLLVLAVDSVIYQLVKVQKDDASYLEAQILQIESKISEIKTLEEQKKLLLERRDIIEKLQASRPFVVQLFDDLAKVMPDGVVLRAMTRKENVLTLAGISDSNYGVSVLMENLQHLSWVKDAKLDQITTEEAGQPAAPADATKSNDNSDTNDTGGEPNTKIKFQLSINIQLPESENNNATAGH